MYTIVSRLCHVQQNALTCTIAKKISSSKPGQVDVKYSFNEKKFFRNVMFEPDLIAKGRKWPIAVLIKQIAHNLKDSRHKKTSPKDKAYSKVPKQLL